MKKSVIIAILLIYIGSIFAVNFFGLKMKIFEGTEYVTQIECTGVELEREKNNNVIQKETDGLKKYYFQYVGGTFTQEDTSNTNVLKINYRAYPDNATNSKIELIYDESAMSGAVIVKEDTLEVVFLKRCGMNLTLKSIDGSNVQTTIYIEAI